MPLINDFDGVCRCACNNHPKFPNILAFTGSFFLVPSIPLYRSEFYLLSSMTTIVSFTSVAYHTTHYSSFKYIDVVSAYSLIICGQIQAILMTLQYRLLALISLILGNFCIYMNVDPIFREDEKTKLHFHILVHLLGVSSLYILSFS